MATVQPPTSTTPKHFGRFELRQLLGKSRASSTWLAYDPRLQQEVMLCVPRLQPGSAVERENWLQAVKAVARLKHPRLSEVLEIGEYDGWPFASYARNNTVTLMERLTTGIPTPIEVAVFVGDVLEGLAYAHEAGIAHEDIGLHNVLVDRNGRAELAGLRTGLGPEPVADSGRSNAAASQLTREATERDVLMVGLMLYRLLANSPALDEPDLASAASRVGREIVRLPWTTPHPVEETLRAIVNRATDRQHRQRYLNARTLLSALQGWVKANSADAGGPLALLLDRLNAVGVLPNRPNTERGLISALSAESLRVDDFVDVIVKNPALAWEMLRSVNVASYKAQSTDEGVTTLSRAVVLLGQQGIRRIAGSVRPWPGALEAQVSRSGETGSQAISELESALRMTCLAGHIARLMAPFSINDEEASVAASSQNLGGLLILYHFPDEAAQIRQLMLPGPPAEEGGPPTPGMTMEGAASAVLGVNVSELTIAVMRYWGMHERLQQAARPLSRSNPVRMPVSAEEILRCVASLANEVIATMSLEPVKAAQAMHNVYLRYARALGLTPKECALTLEQAIRLVDGRPRKSPAVSPASTPARNR
jgi:non-specific serine/threonine protein kinase